MDSGRKFSIPIKFKKPQVAKLLELRQKIKPISMTNFIAKYGDILDLLDVNVNFATLVALAQYYDYPLRCFTFRDFQLVPTIEEFERLLSWPLKDNIPFTDLGEKVVPSNLAETLCFPVSMVAPLLKEKGILRAKLQTKAEELGIKKEDRNAFNAVLALLFFGIVLFPSNDDNYVKNYVISVFLAKNPVPTLVADVLYHHHLRCEKKKGNVLCCVPLLFKWLQSQMPQKGPWVGILDVMLWPQKLDALTKDVVYWYPPSWGRVKVIVSCGDFRNVPLIGSQGCINYNPVLALRQLGNPMDTEPMTDRLDEFILEDFGKKKPTMLERIKNAWTQIHIKDWELGKRHIFARDSYRQWVINRVRLIKLPHVRAMPFPHPEPISTQVLEEENDKLKEILKKKDEEIAALQATNSRYFFKIENLEVNLRETNEELEGRRNQNDNDGERITRYKEELESTTSCIKDLHRQLREAKQKRGEAYLDEERAVIEKEALRSHLGNRIIELEAALAETDSMLENEVSQKEEALISLEIELNNLATLTNELTITREERDSNKDAYEDIATQWQVWMDEIQHLNEKDETISFLEEQNRLYYEKYANLVDLCNLLVIDVPWRLSSAIEDLEENRVPPAISDFLFLCQEMVQRFQAVMKNLKPRRGQHF